ncbi:protein-glutamate methylesterase protein [Rhodovulum sp. PH10]|uniref:chemotaxis protein CheB n=1 Tax=Rhodovulum sp. PH10 TaxID=1187851 RepID=UPI00027C2625|nr:chemotaxis protein CheB [Rhodovulum sp. PH10]EJW12652.1 protein-glutamate methylesterase protein [Rhodovulum sp. PH10]
MANRDIVAIGTSAGGVKALIALAQNFPEQLSAAVLVTIHLPADAKSVLDEILTGAGPLPAHFAEDGETMRTGHIHIAPPGRHLLMEDDRLRLGHGPRENNVRPAIDPMLRSAAICCGPRLIGVVLTGTLGDGASGLWAVGACGGITVVQDPADAEFAQMPETALERVRADHVVGLADLPKLLARLVDQPAGLPVPVPDGLRFDVEIARTGRAAMHELDHHGRRSVLACPDCGGVMWEFDEGELLRFRCHVGHAYTAEMMTLALDENVRRAIASALRGFEERIALVEKLAEQSEHDARPSLAANWRQRAIEYRREIAVLEEALQRMDRAGSRVVAE